MRANSERGVGSLILMLAITAVLLVAALGFGIWAFAGYSDYKTNFDAKLAQQVSTARQQEDAKKDAEFAEAAKSPLTTYKGPSAYGSVTIKYPKTWSGYVSDSDSSNPYIDGYFYPGVVPDANSSKSVFALRVQVIQSSYSNELNTYANAAKQGLAKIVPYRSAKVSGVIGAKITGQLNNGKQGVLVLMPMRNMTLKIWTESTRFTSDLTKYVLPNFTFAP